MSSDKISERLVEIGDNLSGIGERITIAQVAEKLSDKGFGLLLILFAFPMAIPLPYPPGFTTILGLPLLLFSWQMCMGWPNIKLPKMLAEKTLKTVHLRVAIEKSLKYFKMIEWLFKPRFQIFDSKFGEQIIGFFCLLCSVCITLPVLFGNAIPSLAILIMALGFMEKDGVAIFVGVILSIIGVYITGLVIYLFLKFGMHTATDIIHYVEKILF